MVQQNPKRTQKKMTPEDLFRMQQTGVQPQVPTAQPSVMMKPFEPVIYLDQIIKDIAENRPRKIKDWNSWHIGFADGVFLMKEILAHGIKKEAK